MEPVQRNRRFISSRASSILKVSSSSTVGVNRSSLHIGEQANTIRSPWAIQGACGGRLNQLDKNLKFPDLIDVCMSVCNIRVNYGVLERNLGTYRDLNPALHNATPMFLAIGKGLAYIYKERIPNRAMGGVHLADLCIPPECCQE